MVINIGMLAMFALKITTVTSCKKQKTSRGPGPGGKSMWTHARVFHSLFLVHLSFLVNPQAAKCVVQLITAYLKFGGNGFLHAMPRAV